MAISDLKARRIELLEEAGTILDQADTENRSLTKAEESKWEKLAGDGGEVEKLAKQIERLERQQSLEAERRAPVDPIRPHLPARGERTDRREIYGDRRALALKGGSLIRDPKLNVGDLIQPTEEQRAIASEWSLSRFLRGLYRGFEGGEPEARALATSPVTAGGAMVPTVTASQWIDLLRSRSLVGQLGATPVVMESKTVSVPRVVTDPTVAWKDENDPIAASDPTYGTVDLVAKTCCALVWTSVELLEDSAPGIDEMLTQQLVQAVATEIDRVAFVGTTGAKEPEGLYNITGINHQTLSAALTNYDELSKSVERLAGANSMATGLGMSPGTAGALDRLKDQQDQPLQRPPSLSERTFGVSTAIPETGLPAGGSTAIFSGFYPDLYWGIRTGLTVEGPVREAGDGDGGGWSRLQVGWRIYSRIDFAVAREQSFDIVDGITNPA